MNKRIALVAGVLMAGVVSAAMMDVPAHDQTVASQQVIKDASSTELLALWQATASNVGPVSFARPQ